MTDLPKGYFPIAGGYSFAPLRVGLAVRNPKGRDIYIQPGDDESAMRGMIDAIQDCDSPDLAAHMAHVALSDYFEGVGA